MVRAVALVLTVLTGFSGLVYEVAWQKYLATLLGSHSEATAAILAIFLGGLSLGYALFGRVTRGLVQRAARQPRTPSLLSVYGLVEATIGAWAWAFPWLFAGVRALSLALPHGSTGLGFALDVGLTVLLIGPPTVLMGGTIPILTQALAHDLRDATRFHAFVYAFNTAGAFAGALAAGFVLVPQLGLRLTLLVMGAVNLAAGATFMLLGRRVTAATPVAEPAAAAALRVTGFGSYALVAFLGGFAMMAVQTVLNRLGGLAFGASHFTFSTIVAVFVLCIALGSFAVTAFARIPAATAFVVQAGLVLVLAILYLPLQNAPYYAYELRRHFGHDDAAFYPYYLSAFATLLLALGLPIGLSGAVLPLLFHVVRRQVGDLGAVAGRLYSWNTLGSVLGALLGGYALLFWLDLHHVYRLAVVALALAAGILAARLLPARRASLAYAALGVLVVGLGMLPRWSPLRLSSGPFRNHGIAGPAGQGPAAFFGAYEARVMVPFYDDDPTTSVAVWEGRKRGAMPSRAIVNNGKSDGEIPADYCTMILAGILPALLADRAESAFVIGYGTGVTAGELAALGTMQRVDVAEIARGVLRAAPLFEYGNQAAAANPKVHLLRADAYRALVRSSSRYDVIASEPSNPWVTGVEMLYSREFLAAARDHLSPGGVYAQWLHLYETDTETVAMILRTYKAVFDQVAVWYALGDDLILLGFQNGAEALDLERLMSRAQAPEITAALGRSRIRGVGALLAHELLPLGVLHEMSLPGEVHTLFHPRLSHVAARAFFRGATAELPLSLTVAAAAVGERNSLARRYAARFPGGLPDSLRVEVLMETCKYRPRLGATLLAAWEVEHPESPRLGRFSESYWRDPQLNHGLEPIDFAGLEFLLGAGSGGAPPPCEAVPRLSELFATYYHHAAPFRRAALQQAWSACPRDAAVGAARQRFEALAGPADPPR